MKNKLNSIKNYIVDYLEEILVIIAMISFIIFGFLGSFKLGFLCITLSFLFLAYLVIKYKKVKAKERR